MSEAKLERVLLSALDADSDSPEDFPAQPTIDIEVSTLELEPFGEGKLQGMAGFSFSLHNGRTNEALCVIDATFRLLYDLPMPESIEAQRDFAVGRVVHDAWPYWVYQLRPLLGSMGLIPTILTPTFPEDGEEGAREAFDICLQIRNAQPG